VSAIGPNSVSEPTQVTDTSTMPATQESAPEDAIDTQANTRDSGVVTPSAAALTQAHMSVGLTDQKSHAEGPVEGAGSQVEIEPSSVNAPIIFVRPNMTSCGSMPPQDIGGTAKIIAANSISSIANKIKSSAKEINKNTVSQKSSEVSAFTVNENTQAGKQSDTLNGGQHGQGDQKEQSESTAQPVNPSQQLIANASPKQNAADSLLVQPVSPPVIALRNFSVSRVLNRAVDVPMDAQQPLPQSQQAINTARLIQGVGQTEMRVGIQSSEFGAISIHTLATKDALSAQISLDHADLAKALTAHLPEMQAKLGADQTVDVRIHDSSQSMSMTGGRGGSTGSSGESRQQRGGSIQERRDSAAAEMTSVETTDDRMTSSGRQYARLDIRA